MADSPTLAELKDRGRRALAETHRILQDMEKFAADIRRETVIMRMDHGR